MSSLRLLEVHRLAAVAIVALAAACNDSVYSGTDPDVAVAERVVWVGGEIVLASGDFVGADTLPLVILGDDTLTARYAPPDSVVAVAPQRQGIFDLWVGFHGRLPLPFGSVTVGGGYGGSRLVPLVGGYPLRWPGDPRASFLIAMPGGLAAVDPYFGTVRQVFADSVFDQDCYNGPGPAPGGRVVVAGSSAGCGPLVSRPADGRTSQQDTVPTSCWGCRFAAELGPDRWLVFSHQGVQSWSRGSDGRWTSVYHLYSETYDVAMSPTGGLAVPIASYAHANGVPVFSAASVEPAYRLAAFRQVWGAQFTADGDTLYLAGQPMDSALRQTVVLAVARARDGEVLRSATVWSNAKYLVLDPVQPWLYLVGIDPELSAIATDVLDRGTLTPLGHLVSPTLFPSPLGPWYPMLDAVRRRLYVVDTCPWCLAGYGTRVVWFDLLR